MTDPETLVQRIVDGVERMLGTVRRVGNGALLVIVVVVAATAMFGWAMLDGSTRTGFLVLCAVFGAIGIGAAALIRVRSSIAARFLPEFASEIRQLVNDGSPTGQSVIDAFVTTDDDGTEHIVTNVERGATIGAGRQMWNLKGSVGGGIEQFARVSQVVTAITSVPVLLLTVFLIGVGCVAAGFVATIIALF